MSGFRISEQVKAAKAEDEGTVVHVLDRGGVPMYWGEFESDPVTITVAGRYSSKYRRVEESIRKRPLKPRKLTQEVFYEETMEKVIGCTLAWSGFVDDDDKPLLMTRENLHAIYEGAPWVYDQVVEAMNDASNFSQSASKVSLPTSFPRPD